MSNEIGHVFAALAQRRQTQRHDIQPIIKIFAEKPLRYQLTQVLVGRSNDAHVSLDWRTPTDRHIFALLQHPQKAGLRLHGHIANFVQKQCAAIGLLKTTAGAVLSSGEGALFVSEKLRFNQIARNSRHIDRDKRPFSTATIFMQGACDEFFARTRFTCDHNSQIGLHHTRKKAVNLLHGRRPSDEWHIVRLFVRKRRNGPLLGFRKGAADDIDKFRQIEWLGQIFISASLGGADCGHECVLRAHHDNGQFRPHFLIRGSKSKAFSSGIMTSVITRSPSPAATQRHNEAAFDVTRTS